MLAVRRLAPSRWVVSGLGQPRVGRALHIDPPRIARRVGAGIARRPGARRDQRQVHREPRALSECALHFDVTAEHSSQLAGDRESQPRSALERIAAPGRAYLLELVEDPLLI